MAWPKSFDSSNLSRDNLSREIGRHIYIYIYIYTHIYIYMHIHTYTYTYTYVYIQRILGILLVERLRAGRVAAPRGHKPVVNIYIYIYIYREREREIRTPLIISLHVIRQPYLATGLIQIRRPQDTSQLSKYVSSSSSSSNMISIIIIISSSSISIISMFIISSSSSSIIKIILEQIWKRI